MKFKKVCLALGIMIGLCGCATATSSSSQEASQPKVTWNDQAYEFSQMHVSDCTVQFYEKFWYGKPVTNNKGKVIGQEYPSLTVTSETYTGETADKIVKITQKALSKDPLSDTDLFTDQLSDICDCYWEYPEYTLTCNAGENTYSYNIVLMRGINDNTVVYGIARENPSSGSIWDYLFSESTIHEISREDFDYLYSFVKDFKPPEYEGTTITYNYDGLTGSVGPYRVTN